MDHGAETPPALGLRLCFGLENLSQGLLARPILNAANINNIRYGAESWKKRWGSVVQTEPRDTLMRNSPARPQDCSKCQRT